MKSRWATYRAAGVHPLRIVEEPRSVEPLPMKGMLGLILVISLCAFVVVGWQRDGFALRTAGLVAASVCGGLCGLCLVGDVLRAHTKAVTEEYAPSVAPSPSPLTLRRLSGSAHDGMALARAALVRVNGQWRELEPGAATWLAVKKLGWERTEWERARDWLIANGYMRWRSPQHRLGTAWAMPAVSAWLERSVQSATMRDSGKTQTDTERSEWGG